MNLSGGFYYKVIIQRRDIVPPEATVFQTAANGDSLANVVNQAHLVLQKEVKIGGVFSLINPDKPMFDRQKIFTRTYADSGGK